MTMSPPELASSQLGGWHWPLRTRRRVRSGEFGTREAAAAVLEALASPSAPDPGLTTGERLYQRLTSRVSLRASTRRRYAAHVRGYLVPYLGGIPLARLAAGYMVRAAVCCGTRSRCCADRSRPRPDWADRAVLGTQVIQEPRDADALFDQRDGHAVDAERLRVPVARNPAVRQEQRRRVVHEVEQVIKPAAGPRAGCPLAGNRDRAVPVFTAVRSAE
ncbi:MAG TPA: hypothetical protein VG142_06815 [Trebonia sp.]|jgi:hypothetical protein|nr:hypothetical protein [Trebonia sp.]